MITAVVRAYLLPWIPNVRRLRLCSLKLLCMLKMTQMEIYVFTSSPLNQGFRNVEATRGFAQSTRLPPNRPQGVMVFKAFRQWQFVTFSVGNCVLHGTLGAEYVVKISVFCSKSSKWVHLLKSRIIWYSNMLSLGLALNWLLSSEFLSLGRITR